MCLTVLKHNVEAKKKVHVFVVPLILLITCSFAISIKERGGSIRKNSTGVLKNKIMALA